jgi:hypothetical protein
MDKDFAQHMKSRAIEFDIQHQIARLRVGKNMSDDEADTIFYALVTAITTYEQVLEVSDNC